MLTERQIPLEISSLKGSHCRVMLGLFRYADKHGVCWPGLRTLAEAVPISVRALRRALDEMATLGHLAITKTKGTVNRYRIAARFLRAMGHAVRPRAVPDQPAPSAEEDDRQLAFDFARTVSLSGTSVSPLRTEGKARESQEDFIKREAIPFGRDAPLEEPREPKIVKIADSPAVKALKKEARRQKVIRFILAKHAGAELERRMNGMLGGDDTRNEQWWFDKCDAERILAQWDDVRDNARGTSRKIS